MKTIAVIGAGGMLGYAMTEHFAARGYGVIPLSRAEYDIAKEPVEKLRALIEEAHIVVNAAGVIKPRIAVMPMEDVLKVNAIFPRNLAELCRTLEIPCFHITTDCVYSGSRGRYTERAFFDAQDLYGLSKNAGEPGNCMVLRTSIIGEERGQSRSLLEWARASRGKEVSGFTNHLWNGVTTLHLAEIIETIFTENLYREALVHIHSPNTVTKYELLNILNEVYHLSLTIRSSEAKEACDRSLSSVHPLSRQTARKPIHRQVEEMQAFFGAMRSGERAVRAVMPEVVR